MILNSITSWLCSQGYHRPSHSSPGPLYSWAANPADHLLWLMGPAFESKNINTFQRSPRLLVPHRVTPPADVNRSVAHKKQCFQSSFLQFSKEGFIQFLSLIRQSAVDAHWDTFMLDSPLILTSLLLNPKQIWFCKFKPLFGAEHKPFFHLTSRYFQKSLYSFTAAHHLCELSRTTFLWPWKGTVMVHRLLTPPFCFLCTVHFCTGTWDGPPGKVWKARL